MIILGGLDALDLLRAQCGLTVHSVLDLRYTVGGLWVYGSYMYRIVDLWWADCGLIVRSLLDLRLIMGGP